MIVENLLRDYLLNGVTLRVLVVYLPTLPPELNPIELLFHVGVRRYQRPVLGIIRSSDLGIA